MIGFVNMILVRIFSALSVLCTVSQVVWSQDNIKIIPQTELIVPHISSEIGAIVSSQDGSMAAIHRGSGLIEVWNIETNSLVASLPSPGATIMGVSTFLFSPKKNLLYVTYIVQGEVASSIRSTIYLWDIGNLSSIPIEEYCGVKTCNSKEVPIFSDDQRFMLFSRDASFKKMGALFSISRNNKGRLSIKKRRVSKYLNRIKKLSVKFKKTQKRLSSSVWRNRILQKYKNIYQAKLAKYIHHIDGYKAGQKEVKNLFWMQQAAHPNLMYTSVNARLFNRQSDILLQISFNGLQKTIISNNDKVYVETNGKTKRIGAAGGISGASFAQIDKTGQFLVSGHSDGSMRLWSLLTGKQLSFVKVCKKPVVAVAPINQQFYKKKENTRAVHWPRGIGVCAKHKPFVVNFIKQNSKHISDFIVPETDAKIQVNQDNQIALISGQPDASQTNEFARAIKVSTGKDLLILKLKTNYKANLSNHEEYFYIPSLPTLAPEGKTVFLGRIRFNLDSNTTKKYIVNKAKADNPKLFYNTTKYITDHTKSPYSFMRNRGIETVIQHIHERDVFFPKSSNYIVSLSNLNDESQIGSLTLWQTPGNKKLSSLEAKEGGNGDPLNEARVIGSVGKKIVLVGDDNGKINSYLLPSLERLGHQSVHITGLTGISKDSDLTKIVTTSINGEISVWRWSRKKIN